MLATVQKLKDSQSVFLPEVYLRELLLQENDQIEISVKNESIVIKKAARKRRAVKSLLERFEEYTGDYQCFEADTGKPVGLEVW